MPKINLKISGMSCSACSIGLEKYLNKQTGIIDAIVNLVTQEASIEYESNITITQIENWIKEAGFKSLGASSNFDIKKQLTKQKNNLFLLMFLLIIILYLTMGSMLKLPTPITKNNHPIIYSTINLLLTIPTLILSKDIFISGTKNLKNRMPNMDTLVSLGVISSLFISTFSYLNIIKGNLTYLNELYFESIAMILFFIKLGRYIERKKINQTASAIEELVQMTPAEALLKINNQEKKVTIDEIKVDDILIAKPGQKIAVDGLIISGSTHLDESFITGESHPIKKGVGELVVAGSLNYDGIIEYQAKNIGRNSTISEIVHLVVDATNTKIPITRLTDKVSSYFVPLILIIAILVLLINLILGANLTNALNNFATILVVACPCALGLATPLAVVVATSICIKKGLLIKSSAILEVANQIDTIIFDKTGTLTKGQLELSSFSLKNTEQELYYLEVATSIEHYSSHPIEKAFTNYANNKNLKQLPIENFQTLEGMGITATVNNHTYYLGNNHILKKLNIKNIYSSKATSLLKQGSTIIYMIEDNHLIGLFAVSDSIREESKEVISTLKSQGKNIIMLTGDHQEVAKKVANQVGITNVIAGTFPKDKRKIIENLKNNGHKVIMIGDGINDAPSLALADIGISVHGATNIATDSADVILIRNNLTSILDFLIIAKKTFTTIKQNLFWAFFYNSCMIPIAIGFLKPVGITITPMIASLAMTLSSLTVVINTLRLKKLNN